MPSASRWGSLPSCSCVCIDMRADMQTDGTHQQKELDQFPPHAYVDMCGRHVSVACVQTCVQTCAWTCVSTYTYVTATHACAHARAHCVSCARNQRVKPFEKGEFFLKKGEHPGTARIYPTAPSHPSRRGLSDFLMATRIGRRRSLSAQCSSKEACGCARICMRNRLVWMASRSTLRAYTK